MRSFKPRGGTSERFLIGLFAILLGSLLVAIVVAQQLSAKVAKVSDSLVETTIPRIEQIASVRDATLEVQSALAELVHAPVTDRESARLALDEHLSTLRREVRAGTPHATSDIGLGGTLLAFELVAERVRATARTNAAAAHALFQRELLPAANALGDRAMQEIGRSASHGRELALEVAATRDRIIAFSYALVVFSVIVATIGLLALRRKSIRQLALMIEQARDQESKVKEMEQFAGRIAHDVRSPLATASLAAEMLEADLRNSGTQDTVARLRRSLRRAASITEGLLEFARAGARPEPGARTSLRDVVDDITDGVRPEVDRAGIELEIAAMPSVLVPCSNGVLLSMIGNLVRNAIKYMGDRNTKRITLRAFDHGSCVRVEVIDTGPGIAPDHISRLFEPYFRGATNNQAGLGLGLPTVRKLAEGHGGSVGVESILGQGSTFWFELPSAGRAWHADEPTPS